MLQIPERSKKLEYFNLLNELPINEFVNISEQCAIKC